MSKNSKHTAISVDYMNTVLGNPRSCNKNRCKGILVTVFSRYFKQGKVYKELECIECGKVVKSPEFFKDRENGFPGQGIIEQNNRQNRRNNRSSRRY